MEPRRPDGAGWAQAAAQAAGSETWVNTEAGLMAVTEVTHPPRPAYRLTVTLVGGGHCSAADALLALVDFGLLAAQESDFARHSAERIFTCPVDA